MILFFCGTSRRRPLPLGVLFVQILLVYRRGDQCRPLKPSSERKVARRCHLERSFPRDSALAYAAALLRSSISLSVTKDKNIFKKIFLSLVHASLRMTRGKRSRNPKGKRFTVWISPRRRRSFIGANDIIFCGSTKALPYRSRLICTSFYC